MSRLTKIVLSEEERAALESGYKHGKTHPFRQHCHMILLKVQKRTSKDIGEQLGCCLVSVNHWVARYQAEGIEGLPIREGRGRRAILRAILQEETDLPAVRLAVQANRQRLRLAQDALQEELGKQFSTATLKRFLKKTVADTIAYDGG